MSARALSELISRSQPTVSRALAAASSQVVPIGRGRRTRYSAVRDVRGLGSAWPVFRIDATGKPHELGTLTALYGAGTVLTAPEAPDWLRDDFVDGVFPGVPWFLDDQRPQGFLGRQFAHRWASELGLPPDILRWNDDAVIASLVIHGDDGPGNFILGNVALERALQDEPKVIPAAAREGRYAGLARRALAGEAVGSSAAGEQAKFTAVIEDAPGDRRHVIVKFSEPVSDNPSARRWADLLICEHLASQTLNEHGHASATAELIWSEDRLCLEVTRFDRIGAYGRRGCVSLAAWSDAHDGERDDWAQAATRMRQGGWIDAAAEATVRERWWFGRMIANTDMHFGNLAFFLDDALPLQPTPGYDMLPMLYRPSGGGAVPDREFRPPVPTPVDLAYWQTAAAWGEAYWHAVARHQAISEGFRAVAEANSESMAKIRHRFA